MIDKANQLAALIEGITCPYISITSHSGGGSAVHLMPVDFDMLVEQVYPILIVTTRHPGWEIPVEKSIMIGTVRFYSFYPA